MRDFRGKTYSQYASGHFHSLVNFSLQAHNPLTPPPKKKKENPPIIFSYLVHKQTDKRGWKHYRRQADTEAILG